MLVTISILALSVVIVGMAQGYKSYFQGLVPDLELCNEIGSSFFGTYDFDPTISRGTIEQDASCVGSSSFYLYFSAANYSLLNTTIDSCLDPCVDTSAVDKLCTTLACEKPDLPFECNTWPLTTLPGCFCAQELTNEQTSNGVLYGISSFTDKHADVCGNFASS